MPESSDGPAGKAKRARIAKSPKRLGASKVKATFHLSVEANQRLIVHAGMLGKDRSELVEELINTHLRRFVVSDRGGTGAAAGERSDGPADRL